MNEKVYVYNQNREALLASEVVVANTYWKRLVGLLGKHGRWARGNRGLWIVPSRGVHTIGMLFPIDVVFLDRNKDVVHIEEHLRPFSISKVCLKAETVLELPPHTVFRTGTKIGDRLEVTRVPERQNSRQPTGTTTSPISTPASAVSSRLSKLATGSK